MQVKVQILLCIVALVASAAAQGNAAFSLFNRRTIHRAGQGKRAMYPRHVELLDGTLLVTSTISGYNPSFFPVFESKDGGLTFRWISNITDQVNGWGMSAQPALMELTEPMGGYAAGTILASGNSWSGSGTRIDVYASTDKGRSWKFVSRVTQGGRPSTTNGETPVWEPFLMLYEHQLVCYYSDQRDKLHGQKLSHQVSTDLKRWGPVVNDVRYDLYTARPGMTIVAKIETMNAYVVVYELPIGNSSSYGSNYPVYYKIAPNPLEFDKVEGLPIVINNVTTPNASPYVVWSSVGGPNGTIVVSDADHRQVYTNRYGGQVDKWEMHETPQPEAYSRALHVFREYPDHLMILSGATFNNSGGSDLTLSVVSLTETLQN